VTPSKKSKAVIFIDGASRGNPGPSSAGVVIQDTNGKILKTLSKRIGKTTNNIAEYFGLIFALQEALKMKLTEVEIFTDSELLAKQYGGEYKVKDDLLKLLFPLIINLSEGFRKVTVSHVPRERNKLADEAANKALDEGFFL